MSIDENHVRPLIGSDINTSATGFDNTPVLKCLETPITHICNRAIETDVFPKAFKQAVVNPIYRNGDRSLCPGY